MTGQCVKAGRGSMRRKKKAKLSDGRAKKTRLPRIDEGDKIIMEAIRYEEFLKGLLKKCSGT
jgi:hypothetical protein